MDDKLEGLGHMIWKNGETYLGGFYDNQLSSWENLPSQRLQVGDSYQSVTDYNNYLNNTLNRQKLQHLLSLNIYEKSYNLHATPYSSYVGQFRQNQYRGYGKLTFKHTGEVYLGQFDMGKFQGYGCWFKPDAEKIFGIWESGRLVVRYQNLEHFMEGFL